MANSKESYNSSHKAPMQQTPVEAWSGQPYPTYKDSGVEWLGNVPHNWNVLPGHACLREKLQESNADLREKTVLSLSYGKIVVKPPEKLHGLVPSSFETYQIVHPLDIVVRPTDLQNDRQSLRFGLSRHQGIISSAYMCLRTNGHLSPEYAYLLLHAYDLKKIFYGLGSGLRQNLSWEDFKYLPCCVPTLKEQHAIAHFLDHANQRIQRHIHAKEKLIKLLEEQKQVIIHQAVTGQIDVRTGQPYPAYKDSGVEWLGKVPEHWEVRCLGRFGRFLKGSGGTKADETKEGVPCVRYGDLYTRHQFHITESKACIAPHRVVSYTPVSYGDVLFAGSGETLEEIGKSAVNLIRGPAVCGGDVIIFRPTLELDAEFIG